MSTAVDFGASLEEQCEQIWQATLEQEFELQQTLDAPPILFVFDGNQNLQHLLLDVSKLHCEDEENETGVIELELLFDNPVAQWMYDDNGRMRRGEGENFYIDVEKNGVRLTGLYASQTVRKDKKGRRVLAITLTTDYEALKWVDCWSNPFLPAIFQFPRLFLLAGPAIWVLKTALFVNLWRIYSSIWQIPDDPLNPLSWLDGALSFESWDVVIKPTTYLQDLAAGTTWAMFFSRWDKWHDRAKPIMADGEFSVVTRRLREGDPEPWPGAFLMGVHPGQMIVDIVDQSGQAEGIANGGGLFDGLTRVIREPVNDFIETIETELTGDISWPSEFFETMLETPTSFPFVHFPADMGVETEYTKTPAKGIIINTGGSSAPGVNEGISAGVQALGDIIGDNLNIGGYGVGSIGGALDAVLAPFYTDTVAAWISVKLVNRIAQAGGSHLLEYHIDSPGKAYTLSSVLVLRQAVWATSRKKKRKVKVDTSGPYVVGWKGTGHFYKGDRGSFEIAGDTTGEIHVERAMKMTLDWEADHFAQWEAEFGQSIPEDEDPVVTILSRLEEVASAAHTFGVW